MIGEALRLIRVFHDLKQYEAAELLGISKSHICDIENGNRKPTLSLIEKYSACFKIPASSILFFAEEIDDARSGNFLRKGIASKVITLLKTIEMRADA